MTLSLDIGHPVPSPSSAGAPPLLVPIREVTDLEGPLAHAADRARAEHRLLLVTIVAPAHPRTIDAAIHQRHARRTAALDDALLAGVHRTCADVPVRVLRERTPWALSRGRLQRALWRRLTALAERHGAELVLPSGPAPVAPQAGAAR